MHSVLGTYDFVPPCQGDDTALDGESRAISTSIASNHINTAVSGNEGRGSKCEEKNFCEHGDSSVAKGGWKGMWVSGDWSKQEI